MTMTIIETENLCIRYNGSGKSPGIRALDGVSITVRQGESTGLVGESGCGKTTLANAVLRMLPPTSGAVRFEGRDVWRLSGAELLRFRRRVQMVFQDPTGALNPRLSVGASLEEVLRVHGLASCATVRQRVTELLAAVGLEPVYATRYPHELSGGQRQRVGIARALAVEPALLICDEPVSALDVSVQIQILNLLKSIRRQAGLAYLFIAHDLAVVRYMCERVLVMYRGRVVEEAPTEDLFQHPAHPYTVALLSAVPDVERGLKARHGDSGRIVLRGDMPSPVEDIPGCPFHTRCWQTTEICCHTAPPAVTVADGHISVCHFAKHHLR